MTTHLREALEPLVAQHDAFMRAHDGCMGNHADAYNMLAKRFELWDRARTALLHQSTGGEAELREALVKCRDTFLRYERMHLAKIEPLEHDPSTEPGAIGAAIAKADNNRDMADMCDAALSTPSLEVSGGGWLDIESAPKDGTPYHIVTDAKGFESIVESNEDGEPKGDLICHVFGDQAGLLVNAPRLHRALLQLLTIAGTPITERQEAIFAEARAVLAATSEFAPAPPSPSEGTEL